MIMRRAIVLSFLALGLQGVAPLGLPPNWQPVIYGQIGGFSEAIAAADHYVYVGIGTRLVIFDVADPANPVVVGRTPVLTERLTTIALSGTFAYLGMPGQLLIYDVRDPARPTFAGAYAAPLTVDDLALAGPYAYVATYDDGLRVLDVSDPRAIREIGWLAPADTQFFALNVAGSYVYVTGFKSLFGYGLFVIDVSDPSTPRETGALAFPRTLHTRP